MGNSKINGSLVHRIQISGHTNGDIRFDIWFVLRYVS